MWAVVPLSCLGPTSALGYRETSKCQKLCVTHGHCDGDLLLSLTRFVERGSCSCQCDNPDFCTSPDLASTGPHCLHATSPATVSSTSRKSAKCKGFRSRGLVIIVFRWSFCRGMWGWWCLLSTPNPLQHCALPYHLRGNCAHMLRNSWNYEEQVEQL